MVALSGLTSRIHAGSNQGYAFDDYSSSLRQILHAAQTVDECDLPGSGRWPRSAGPAQPPPSPGSSGSASAIWAGAVLVGVGVAAGVLLVRGEWAAKAVGAFVILTAACVVQTVLIRTSRDRRGELPYNASALVLLAEVAKLLFALAATLWGRRRPQAEPGGVSDGAGPQIQWQREAVYYLVPALTYAAQNNLVYLGLTYLDAPTFTMLASMKVVTTAFLHFVVFKRVPSEVQRVSIVLLAAGIAVSKLQALGADGGSDATVDSESSAASDLLVGTIVMLVNASLSAFSGVSNEWLIKKTNPDTPLMQKNAALYGWGVAVNGCWLLVHPTAGFAAGLDRGLVWLIVAVNAATGLAVSLNIKHANVVVSSFATAVAVYVSALVSALVDEFDLSVQFWLGAVIFSGALFLFARAQPAAAAKQEQPLEEPLLSAGSE